MRVLTAVIVLVVGLSIVGGIAVGVFMYAYDPQFDRDKETMRTLIARDLGYGVSPSSVTRFVQSPDFLAVRRAPHFDDVYRDIRPVPVALSIFNLPTDPSLTASAQVMRIELDRAADDVKMDVTLLFDKRGAMYGPSSPATRARSASRTPPILNSWRPCGQDRP